MCSRTSHSRPLALTQYDIAASAEYFEFSWQLFNLGQSFQTPALTVCVEKVRRNLVLSRLFLGSGEQNQAFNVNCVSCAGLRHHGCLKYGKIMRPVIGKTHLCTCLIAVKGDL